MVFEVKGRTALVTGGTEVCFKSIPTTSNLFLSNNPSKMCHITGNRPRNRRKTTGHGRTSDGCQPKRETSRKSDSGTAEQETFDGEAVVICQDGLWFSSRSVTVDGKYQLTRVFYGAGHVVVGGYQEGL